MNYLLRCVLSLIIHYIQDAYLSPTKRQTWLPSPQNNLSIVSNYRTLSLLNSEDKVLERLVFKHLYNHWHCHNLISSLQSGFMPGDSTVNQPAYLHNTFCQSLDVGKEVRVVFCDISKAFDRVWHSGLLLKLQAAGVTGEVWSGLKVT